MSEHEQLLDEARRFCNPATGEVLERIPEELMTRLRAAKLALGIPGKPSQRTQSEATWFVFLNFDIQDRVLAEWRKAKAAQDRLGEEGSTPAATRDAPNVDEPSTGPAANHGLKGFVQRRKLSR